MVGVVQREESEIEPESTEDDAFLGTVRQGSTDPWVAIARVKWSSKSTQGRK